MAATVRMAPNSVKSFTINFNFTQVNALTEFELVVGGNATSPATLADLGGTCRAFTVVDMTTFDLHMDADGTRLSGMFLCPALDASLDGVNIWLCLFREAFVGGGAIPDHIAGPILQGLT